MTTNERHDDQLDALLRELVTLCDTPVFLLAGTSAYDLLNMIKDRHEIGDVGQTVAREIELGMNLIKARLHEDQVLDALVLDLIDYAEWPEDDDYNE